MKIAFIPIDNRPVCYTLPKLISQMDESLELVLPERNLLGGLVEPANVDGLFAWLAGLSDIDTFVISLDTIAYGGLVSSRRCPESFDEIKLRLDRLKPFLQNKKVYAFSSIMRISNNNINEEEKSYWDKWGKKIFDYSWHSHKNSCESCIANVIPACILDDYLETRKRNFEINKIYVDWQKEGIFETLIFSKDDCAEYGFNVQEAKALEALGAIVKTGADEIPLTLLARAIDCDFSIKPIFTESEQKHLISNYEDISIEKCVQNQVELAGCSLVEQDANFTLLVNNFVEKQGEIVMKIPTAHFSKSLKDFCSFDAVVDVRFANGADNVLVSTLFENGFVDKIKCYSAWNTSANSMGCLICALKVYYHAQKNGTFVEDAFNKFMLTRFLDDWAYQANVRQILDFPDVNALKDLMCKYEVKLLKYFPIEDRINYKFTWNRLFEVEVEFI